MITMKCETCGRVTKFQPCCGDQSLVIAWTRDEPCFSAFFVDGEETPGADPDEEAPHVYSMPVTVGYFSNVYLQGQVEKLEKEIKNLKTARDREKRRTSRQESLYKTRIDTLIQLLQKLGYKQPKKDPIDTTIECDRCGYNPRVSQKCKIGGGCPNDVGGHNGDCYGTFKAVRS